MSEGFENKNDWEMPQNIKIILCVLGVFLSVVIICLIVFRDAVYAVYRNLTAPVYMLNNNDEWSGGESYIRVPYALESDAEYLDLYVPYSEEKPPLFVLVHGGGFITNDSQSRQAKRMYRYFRDCGFACASVNYRLAQEAGFPAALLDVKAAVRFLRAHEDEYGYDASHIAIWGESAGGYLATMAAITNDDEFMELSYIGQESRVVDGFDMGTAGNNGSADGFDMSKGLDDGASDAGTFVSAKVDVLIDYYGHTEMVEQHDDWKTLKYPQIVIDIGNSWENSVDYGEYEDLHSYFLRQHIKDLSDDEIEKLNPYYYIDENFGDGDDPAVWITHGDCDITVPYLMSERFYDALSMKLPEDKLVFNLVPDMGHASDPLYSDEELARICDFIYSYVAK